MCDNGNCGPGGNIPPFGQDDLTGTGGAAYSSQARRPATQPAQGYQQQNRQSQVPSQQFRQSSLPSKPAYGGTPAKTVATGTNMRSALQTSVPTITQPTESSGNYSYYAGSSQPSAKPSQQAPPALIGPLGYDDLK